MFNVFWSRCEVNGERLLHERPGCCMWCHVFCWLLAYRKSCGRMYFWDMEYHGWRHLYTRKDKYGSTPLLFCICPSNLMFYLWQHKHRSIHKSIEIGSCSSSVYFTKQIIYWLTLSMLPLVSLLYHLTSVFLCVHSSSHFVRHGQFPVRHGQFPVWCGRCITCFLIAVPK